jgi:hypothetical protein
MYGTRQIVLNSLLLIVVMAIYGIVNAKKVNVHIEGRVYCTYDGEFESPLENVEVALMEEDGFFLIFTIYFIRLIVTVGFLIDPDDTLATTRTDANGAYSLEGKSSEEDGLETYLVFRACHSDSACSVYKTPPQKDVDPNTVKPGDIYMTNEFCQHLCNNGKCRV